MMKYPTPPSAPDTGDAVAPTTVKPRATWLNLGVIFLLVGVVALVFGGRTVYRGATGVWGRHLSDQALDHMKEEKWESAARKLGDAVRTSPEDPHVLRTTAEFLRKTNGDPEMARFFLQKIHDSPHANPEDSIRLGDVLILNGDTPRARAIYDSLPTASKQSRAGMELLAKIFEDEGQKQLAMATLRQALLADPSDPECILHLAMLDLDQPFNETRKLAQETIWKLARANDDTALQAIGFLATSRELTAGEADELLKTVKAHPKSADRHRLMVLSAYIRLFPTRRQQVLDDECDKVKGKGIDDMVHVLRWLAEQKQADRIFGLVPKSLVVKSADAFPPYADALMATGKWTELKALIQGSPAPAISQANAHAYLAACHSKLDPNLVETKHQIDNAYRAAAKSGEQQITMRTAQLAENLGLWDQAAEGYETIGAKNARVRIAMLTKVYEMALLTKNGGKMLDVSSRISAARPESWMFRARADYLSLVLGSGFEKACESVLTMDPAKSAATREPEATSYLAVLRALAAYRIGDKARIQSELNSIELIDALPPGLRAVTAGLLKIANGDPALAYRLAEAVPPSILLQEELRFLNLAL